MAQRALSTEANKSGSAAVTRVKHSVHPASLRHAPAAPVLRMPSQYTTHDVELLLEVIWNMFTESQARKLRVTVPWDDSDEPQTMVLADVAALLESWLA